MIELSLTKIRSLIDPRPTDSYKGNYGHSLIIGGNEEMGGAALLAASACVHVGSGLTSLLTSENNIGSCHAYLPEIMVGDWLNNDLSTIWLNKADQVLIGPGMGRSKESIQLLKTIISKIHSDQVLILDGDAITLWAQEGPFACAGQLIFTPHLGEWSKLKEVTGIEDPQVFSDHYQAILVSKSHQTKIYQPSGLSYSNISGNPGMAIGGMGDCLAGMITGLMGQCSSHLGAVLIACYMHTAIANRIYQNNYIVLPSRIIQSIPGFMKDLFQPKGNQIERRI
ncbi:NAD(P)H-hydrate dehydratase [Facklamia miroungae]|uniref:ADP-dependent (S)-NAD(P)H-hydrate dehydratase n=1 Tax=Facklamia miroungae TaxID=120956 RepID=A0A1G7QNF8_9LACT|nr:NAD(P)H-hydrate dehydratase [Facklamia miroungae]NKZ28979.1 NAD(P)H-hydrate dehydratase [Facklamia miroungae]SDF99170.1 yjeF C-terminal region, hydroxyethylthiazole kinase-related [Facklamia miroungae]